MVYLTLNAIITSFSLAITKDRDVFSSYLAKIKALFIAFPASKFIFTRAVDKFSAVCSASTKSRI
jgi:hypothetical protein